ncbi:hypothetical protein [Lacticaseibacillus daqingensis]|uniref:hypothetical protein n=1 Tax=Lacticaseibacillus daqingensis TaxID=2486014 RepID=UPI000F768418|nr:hypothetical protein [Lacticaseibacillus daqingensis]
MDAPIRAREIALLKRWMARLMANQVASPEPRFGGGALCPSCLHFHGRVIDSIYPLMTLADLTGDARYREAAERFFTWGDNLYCDDHSYYNDAQQTWNKTTIFFAQSLEQALEKHGHLLAAPVYAAWHTRLHEIAEWLLAHFTPADPANTNYHAAGAAAMAMCGHFFEEPRYFKRARELAAFCQGYLTPDHLLFGEGNPRARITAKGCYSVDVGYSLEETLPNLIDYAVLMEDAPFYARLVRVAQTYLPLMLPDGGMDNSFGTRNFKWTYWGSRTSDGTLAAFTRLSQQDPAFDRVVEAQLSLLERCTHAGYLYGGPDYATHGEAPCLHHLFAHAKVLAACIDAAPPAQRPTTTTELTGWWHLAAVNTSVWRTPPFYASVTATDYAHFEGGHSVGGVMGMLWHRDYGPILASGMTDTTDREPLNTQLSRQKATLTSSAWRLMTEAGGVTYSNVYDLTATMAAAQTGATVQFNFADQHFAHLAGATGEIRYEVADERVSWTIRTAAAGPVTLRLPIRQRHDWPVKRHANGVTIQHGTTQLVVSSSATLKAVQAGFALTPGFELCVLEFDLAPATAETVVFEVEAVR